MAVVSLRTLGHEERRKGEDPRESLMNPFLLVADVQSQKVDA